MAENGHRFGLLNDPLLGFVDDDLLLLERQPSEQDPAAKENEIGVEYVAAAVSIDLGRPPGIQHGPHLRAVDSRFSGFADESGEEIEAAGKPRCTEVREQVAQVEVR